MDCSEAGAHLSLYIDGRLDEGRRSQLEEHIVTCSNCKTDVAILKRYLQQAQSLPLITAPNFFENNVRCHIEKPWVGLRLLSAIFDFVVKYLSVRNIFLFILFAFFVVLLNPHNSRFRHAFERAVGLRAGTLMNDAKKQGRSIVHQSSLLEDLGALGRSFITPFFGLQKEEKVKETDKVVTEEVREGKTIRTEEDLETVTLRLKKNRVNIVFGELAANITTIMSINGGKVLYVHDEKPQYFIIQMPSRKFIMVVNELNDIGDFYEPLPTVSSTSNESFKLRIYIAQR